MDQRALIDVIRREGEAMAAVPPSPVDVPTCPGWTITDLYHHVGSVHRWQLAQIDPPDVNELAPPPAVPFPDDEDLDEWLLDGVDALADRLEVVGPDHMCASWFGPRPAIFWARRAAHETAVHRWDGQAASASPAPFPAAQAVDGLDELLEVVLPRRLRRRPWSGAPATLHLHATDTDLDGGEWMLELDGATLGVTHDHGKGDAAVRGPASDLLLLVAGRIPLSRLEVFGDRTIIDRWQTGVDV